MTNRSHSSQGAILMRNVVAIVTALCVPAVVTAADFDPLQGPKPLVVFIQTNPWLMAVGSDTPRVAIYENGEVIFEKEEGDRLTYRFATLDEKQFENVRAQLAPALALNSLKPRYNIRPNMSDQPEAKFYLRDGQREVVTSVYGLMADDTRLPGYTVSPKSASPTAPPNEVFALHKWLCELDFANNTQWTPKYVQVMFWDYSYAPDKSIHWPEDWPSLNSDRAIKRGDIHSVFLDGSMIPELRKFLATRKQKGAVEIAGQKMTASYRFVFPSERDWRRAFAKVAPKIADPE